jgi:hypothetical protein
VTGSTTDCVVGDAETLAGTIDAELAVAGADVDWLRQVAAAADQAVRVLTEARTRAEDRYLTARRRQAEAKVAREKS